MVITVGIFTNAILDPVKGKQLMANTAGKFTNAI